MASENWRNAEKWSRDVNGYAICPCCGAMIHQRMVDIHANTCWAIEQEMARAAAQTESTQEGSE